ncbi:MAG: WG repeat-containing protein [Verrucomicrobiaceae bacterium]|nr:WG repeat-containing protein [Verrucomicrobiaceae bacterium]
MKRIIPLLILLAVALHAEEIRTFTAVDGRTLKATIVSKTDTHVTIRRAEDGQEFLMSLERLSAADQAFVKAWKQVAAASAAVAPVKFTKTWVVEPKWDAIRAPMEGMAPVRLAGKWGFVNEQGQTIGEVKWEEVGNFVEGLAAVKSGGKWGFIDKEGKVSIEPTWNEVLHFQEGLAPVKQGSLWGFIDKTGQLALEPAWETVFTFTDGMACVEKGGLYGFIDTTGKVVIEPTWKLPGRFSHGVVELKTEVPVGKSVVLNKRGDILYEKSIGNSDGFPAEITEHGITALENVRPDDPNPARQPRSLLMSFEGRVIHEQSVRAKIEFHEGQAAVWLQDNQLTFIDPTGARAFKTIFVAPEFKMMAHFETRMYRFSEGLAAVPGRDAEKKHKLRYLDKNGTVIIPARWVHAGPFSEGLALVSNTEGYPNEKTQWKIINRDGVEVAEVQRQPTGGGYGIPAFKSGLVPFVHGFNASSHRSDSRIGFIGRDGKVAIQDICRQLSSEDHFKDGRAIVGLATLRTSMDWTDQAVIDTTGAVVAAPVRGSSDRATYRDSEAKTDGLTACGGSPRSYGLLNAAGKVVVPPSWEDAEILSPDLVAFKMDGKFGLVNGTGEVVLPATITGIDYVDVLSATHVWVRKDGQTGSLSIRSGEFTPQEKPDYHPPSRGTSDDAFVLFEDPTTKLYGIKAKDGTITLPPKYAAGYRASGNRFWVSDDKHGWSNGFALIDETGKALTEPEWFRCKGGLTDGLMLVMKDFNGDSGYMDENGKLAIPLSPGRKSNFDHGAAMVWADGKSGLINTKGEWIWKSSAEAELAEIGFTNDFSGFLQHGLAIIEKPLKWGLVRVEKASP